MQIIVGGKISSYVQYSKTMMGAHYDNYRNSQGWSGVRPGDLKGDGVDWDNGTFNDDIIVQSTYTNDFYFGDWGNLIFNGGLYYMWEQLETNQSSHLVRHMNQAAIFAEAEYLINQYVSTTLGLRYNYSDIFKAIPNPRFYVNYNPLDWLTFKAGIATGVLVPTLSYLCEGYTISTSRGTITATYGNKDLEPEQSVSYEISAIVDAKPAMLILTGFYTDFSNKISSITGVTQGQTIDGVTCNADGATQCTFYRNLDRALIAGFELTFSLKPIYGFGLDASYGYTYSETRRAKAGQEYLIGEPVNDIPMHKFTIKPSYTYENFNVYIRWTGIFKTTTSASDPTSSTYTTSARNLLGKYYKDYQLVDVAVSYRFNETYSATFAINNIFDTKFYNNLISYYNANGVLSYLNVYQRILPARNFWISFKADW